MPIIHKNVGRFDDSLTCWIWWNGEPLHLKALCSPDTIPRCVELNIKIGDVVNCERCLELMEIEYARS